MYVCGFISRNPYSLSSHEARFYAILYPSHLLISVQNFTEIVQRERLRRELKARGVVKYSDVGHIDGYMSETVQDMASGPRVQLITYRRIQWYHLGSSRMTP